LILAIAFPEYAVAVSDERLSGGRGDAGAKHRPPDARKPSETSASET
jgi:hypothetical protein